MFRAVVCVVVGIAASARAAIINVGSGESIQAAINIAADGDTVVVAPGTYHQAITFLGKAITVRSSGGPQVTILDATGLATSVVKCINDEGPDTVLEGFTVTGGTGSPLTGVLVGGGMYNFSADTIIRNCIFLENSADEGAAIFNRLGHPTIRGCDFIGNTATMNGDGGGAIYNKLSNTVIIDCIFAVNDGALSGGAILNVSSLPSIINCQFHDNTAMTGGAIHNIQSSTMLLVNCNISDNTASLGGGIMSLDSTLTVYNSILWGNSPEQIYELNGTPSFEHCDVMGGWDGAGSNNLDADPMFVDASSGNYHLMPGSPCVNGGDSTAVPPAIETDLDGNPRFVGPVDLGPYELQGIPGCPWDLDGDGEVGVTDILDLLAQWGTDPGGPPDFGGDGSVSVVDLLELLGNWGPCS